MLLLGAGLCAAPREPRCAARQEQPMQLLTAGDRYGAGSSKGPGDPAWGWPGESGEAAPRAGRCGAARGALAALRALFCLWEQSLVPEGRPVTGHGPQPHAAIGPSAPASLGQLLPSWPNTWRPGKAQGHGVLVLGTGAWGLCVGARTAGLEQRVPCPRRRQSGCSDSITRCSSCLCPFHGIGRTGHCKVLQGRHRSCRGFP